MLSVAIKNIILVTLIVLIIHFLLKNFALNTSVTPSTTSPSTAPLSVSKQCGVDSNDIPKGFYIEKFDPLEVAQAPSTQAPQAILPSKVSQLVDTDDGHSAFEAYFKEPSPIKVDNESCKVLKDHDDDLRPNALCGVKMKADEFEDSKKDIKADCDLKQDKKVFMLTTEYEKENTMNGGNVMGEEGELGAFDAFDLYYESYSS